MTDPVQVVAEARQKHVVRERFIGVASPGHWECYCGTAMREQEVEAHRNIAIVAALREAGLLAEGKVVGYVPLTFADPPTLSRLVSGSKEEAVVWLREGERVAALHLLPDTEEPGNG